MHKRMSLFLILILLVAFQSCGKGFDAITAQNSVSIKPFINISTLDSASLVLLTQEDKTLFAKVVLKNKTIKVPIHSNCKTNQCGTLASYETLKNPDAPEVIAVVYDSEAINGSTTGSSGVAVVDTQSEKLTANFLHGSVASYNLTVLYPNSPGGLKRPVITSGYTSFNHNPDSGTEWGTYLCIYSPGFNDPGCGPGFGKWDIRPSYSQYGYAKHQSGMVYDANSDGWEDIYLPFFGFLMVVNGQSGQIMVTYPVNYAASNMNFSNQPYSSLNPNFHSGRSYGLHSLRVDNGSFNHVIIGGNPVGTFGTYAPKGDYSKASDGYVTMCGVSRFVAMLRGSTSSASSMSLNWSRYMSFYQPVFAQNASSSSSTTAPPTQKDSDMVQRCIHHFGNSRLETLEKEEVIAFNLFEASNMADNCVPQMWDYQRTGSSENFHACLAKNINTGGRWVTKFISPQTGYDLFNLDSSYTWGMVSDLIEKDKKYILVEPMSAGTGFNVPYAKANNLLVYQISSSGSWHGNYIGRLPIAERPEITYPRRTQIGSDAETGFGFAALTAKDYDGDGLTDIKLSSGQWVGYSKETKSFIPKN